MIITEIKSLNDIHFSKDEYYQIDDMFFRKLIAILNDIK